VTANYDLATPGAAGKVEIYLTVFDGLGNDKHPQATPAQAREKISIISRLEFAHMTTLARTSLTAQQTTHFALPHERLRKLNMRLRNVGLHFAAIGEGKLGDCAVPCYGLLWLRRAL